MLKKYRSSGTLLQEGQMKQIIGGIGETGEQMLWFCTADIPCPVTCATTTTNTAYYCDIPSNSCRRVFCPVGDLAGDR